MNLRKFAKDVLTKLTMHSCTFTSAFEEQNAIIWNYYENVFTSLNVESENIIISIIITVLLC